MTKIKIKRSELGNLTQDQLLTIHREATKLKDAAKLKTLESYETTAHEGQHQFSRAAATHRIRYFIGSNRSGKSTAGFVEDIRLATGQHPYLPNWKTPCRGVVIVQDFENAAKNILEPKFNEWSPSGSIDKIERNQMGAIRKIIYKNGSIIDVLSHDQDIKVFEGSDYDFAHFDEPPPHKIYTAVWRGLTDRGGIMYITATPLASPWLYKEIKKAEIGDKLRFLVKVNINQNAKNIGGGDIELGRKRIEDFAELLPESERAARLDGESIVMQGLIFKKFDERHHMIPEFDIPARWKIYESIDPHAQKPWAVSWIAESDNGYKILLKSEYFEGSIETIANQIIIGREEISIKGGNKPRIVRCLIDNSASVPTWQKSNTDPTAERISVRQELENYIGPMGSGGPPVEVAPKNVSQKIKLFEGWIEVTTNSDGGKESFFYAFENESNKKFKIEIENYVWDSSKGNILKDKPKKEGDDILDTIMQVALTLPKESTEETLEPVKIMRHTSWTVR